MSDEADGLDEASDGVPVPNTAAGFTIDFALPRVMPRRVRPLAVVSFALAFVAPFVAIPLGHHVLRQVQHDGGRGGAIAHAAIVLGYLVSLLLALIGLNLVVALFLHTP